MLLYLLQLSNSPNCSLVCSGLTGLKPLKPLLRYRRLLWTAEGQSHRPLWIRRVDPCTSGFQLFLLASVSPARPVEAAFLPSIRLVFITTPSQSRQQSFMNSSGRSWTVRGGARAGNKARRCWWNRWRGERTRGTREVQGGVAVLLNFNEYQGEFLLGFFFLLPLHSFFPGIQRLPHCSKSLSHK